MNGDDQYLPPQNKEQLVVSWIRRAREAQFGHYELANIYSSRDRWLGIPVIVITAFVGTAVFASMAAEAFGLYEKILVGMLSIVATGLLAYRHFLIIASGLKSTIRLRHAMEWSAERWKTSTRKSRLLTTRIV